MIDQGKVQADKVDAILVASVSDEDLLREIEEEWEGYLASHTDTKRFWYASLLANSKRNSDKMKSLEHFNLLLFADSTDSSITMRERGQLARDSLYFLATTHYALGHFDKALGYCEQLYRREPDNAQLQTLHQAIKYKYKREQVRDKEHLKIGFGIGAVAVVASIIGLVLLKKR
jgi:tetratricopeptide (TPR) repeat protein